MPAYATRNTARRIPGGAGNPGIRAKKFRQKQILQSHGLLNGKRKRK